MQINNNPQCPCPKPAFGMALKIKPEAMEDLTKASMEKLQTIKRIGEELSDTRYADLEIGKGLTPRIKTHYANAYLPPFKVENPKDSMYPEYLNFQTTWDGTNLGGDLVKGAQYNCTIPMESKEAALEAYAKVKAAPTELEQAAELTKLVEQRLDDKAQNDKLNQILTQKRTDFAKDLFNTFGVDA